MLKFVCTIRGHFQAVSDPDTTVQIYCTTALMDLCYLERITSPFMTGCTATNIIAMVLFENPGLTSLELPQQGQHSHNPVKFKNKHSSGTLTKQPTMFFWLTNQRWDWGRTAIQTQTIL